MQARARARLAALGAAPLAAGAVLPPSVAEGDTVLCPWRSLTGVPCPLCGATRAFVYAGHLDGRWLDYGAVWVVAALALVAVALLAPRAPAPRRRTVWAGAALLVATAWAWALAHAGTIAPG